MSLDTKEGAWRLGARRRHGTVEVGDLVPLPQRLVVGRVTNHVPAVRRKADRDCAEGTEGAEGAKRAGNGVSRGRVDNGQRGGFGGDRGRGVCVNPGQNWAGNGCRVCQSWESHFPHAARARTPKVRDQHLHALKRIGL